MATKKESTNANVQDAIALLTAEHKAVKALFKEFEELKEQDNADEEMAILVRRICTELTIHATIEEEIFYPAVREAIEDDDLMDEADVEHATAKELIAQLQAAKPSDDHYHAKVTVLGECVNHHIKEEQDEIFPKVRSADVDTAALGIELMERKEALMAELGTYTGEEKEEPPPPKSTAKKAAPGARK